MSRALIIGVSGHALSPEEKAFIDKTRPTGLIVFARNISGIDQLRALVGDFRKTIGDEAAPVLIDQEGGRVQRLRPPLAPNYPSAKTIGDIHLRDAGKGKRAAWLTGRLIGDDLISADVDVDCDPVLDLRVKGANDIIGSRSYAEKPEAVITLARAKMDGLLAAGVLPVIKHIPGHGRALSDSHEQLPVVATKHAELSKTDFMPFKALHEAPFAMTAHVVYSDIDAHAPATTSKIVIDRIIRREIGFDGALMSDDLGMKALSGSFAERASGALDAGCDLILHCSGDMAEMKEIANIVPELSGEALRRFKAALARRQKPQFFERRAAEAELKDLLAGADASASFETLVA